MNPERDQDLARALATLDVPEHRLGFWEALEADLVAHRVDRTHRPRRRPTARPGRPGRSMPRIALVAAAVVVVVGGVVGITVLRGDRAEPVRTVGDVASEVSDALASLDTLHGTLTTTEFTDSGQPLEQTFDFWRASDGSYRIEYPDGEIAAYDAATGTLTTSMLVETGHAIGPPDGGVFGSALLDEQVSTAVQAMAAEPDAEVIESTVDGRDAYLIDIPISPDLLGDGSPNRMEIVIDRGLRVPLAVTRFTDDRVVHRAEFHDLRAGDAAPEGIFTAPVGDDAVHIDDGFVRMATPAEAAAAAGYAAPVPASAGVPTGFALAGVAHAAETQGTGAEGMNPPSVDVVTLLYTRGFEWFTVSTRREDVPRDPESVWTDPIAGEGTLQQYDSVVLGSGRFAGTTVERSLTAPFVPHLWGIGDGLVLTVAGNLSADELVAVAESIG